MSQTNQSAAMRRIVELLDEKSFVEIGACVQARNTDFNMPAVQAPADGVVTGYGSIEGNLVYVYSQDAAVLGGSMGEMHAKKILALYDYAMKMGAPIIGLVDCAGLRLQEATDALDAFGRLYLAQTMASGVIPQLKAVFGCAGGGMAVSLGLDDFVFMAEEAKVFVNTPNAILGNTESKCDTACAKFHSAQSGVADFTGTREEVLAALRELISILPANSEDNMSYSECEDDLNRMVPEASTFVGDTALLLADISDEHHFYELKKEYAREMITCFIRLNGNTVGCVANRTEVWGEDGSIEERFEPLLTKSGVDKASRFVRFCDAFGIPLLCLVNTEGYQAKKCTEKHIVAAAARLCHDFANATVPKLSLIVGKAYGSAYLCMNSKAIGADMVYAYPHAKIGMMEAESAVRIMYAQEIEQSADAPALIAQKAAEYENLQGSALSAAKRAYVDAIIEPAETRKRVLAAFEMLFTKREDRPAKKHATV